MSAFLVTLRLWHGGIFVDNSRYTSGKFLDIIDYDVFEYGEAFIDELLLADFGYEGVVRYALKDKNNGEFVLVKVHDDESDFVTNAFRFVDDKNILEIYCDCKEKTENEKKNVGDDEDVDEEENEEDFDFDDKVIEDDPEFDDGLDDVDFSDEDDEFIEARRNERLYREAQVVCYNTQEKGKDVCENTQNKEKSVCQNSVTAIVEGKGVAQNTEEVMIDLDELDSDASCESLDDMGRKKVKTKLYSKSISPKDLDLELGLRFKDPKECQEVVRHWAVANGYNIKWTKSSRGKLQAVCSAGCNWKMYASLIHGEPTCVIKTLSGKHTCVRAQYNRQVNSKFVAAHFMPKLRNNANITNKEMVDEINLVYGSKVRPMKCYRAKWLALEQIRGTFNEHYAKLRPYVLELMRNDKEGHFELKTYLDKQEQPVFERLYIGFSALRKGFLVGCRKYIGFDACFLKTVLGGTLLAAVSKDCNNKMYPIAWAVVEKENEQSWSWFFERLFDDLNISDGLGWTFMSDKQKGLINGIQRLAPNSEHRHCARHIYANWKKHFAGPKFKVFFWKIVRATSKLEYDLCLNELRRENPQAAIDFESRGPTSFCKALINSFTKTDTIDNNMSETFNSYILKSRDKPLIDMLEDIRMSIMTRIYDLSTSIEKNSDSSDLLCPNIRKKLTKIHESVRFCNVRPAVGGKYEVHCNDDSHVVDLVGRICTCRAWELTGIPCCHGLSCIFHNREDPVVYVDSFYYKANVIECYKFGLSPLRGYKSWPLVEEAPVLPPEYSKPTGRPKKRRRRGLDDMPNKSTTRFSLRGLRMSCKNCGVFGHNKRTCKEIARANQEPARVPMERVPQAKQPRDPSSSTKTPKASNTEQREMRQARQGYGALLSTETGSIYIRDPGTHRVHFFSGYRDAAASRPLHNTINSERSSRGSQGTQDSQVDNPTPP